MYIMYLARFRCVTLDTYINRIHQGYMYLGIFIAIHQDTKLRYMYTAGIHSGYMMGYMCLKCIQRGMYLKCKLITDTLRERSM